MTLDTWERRSDWPLTVLAVVFLGCYAWPILQPDLDPTVSGLLSILSYVIWAAFIVDFVGRVYLADNRRVYVTRHLFDLVMLVLPMLRPLRALRILVGRHRHAGRGHRRTGVVVHRTTRTRGSHRAGNTARP
jgi:voltage-gated potassium channel